MPQKVRIRGKIPKKEGLEVIELKPVKVELHEFHVLGRIKQNGNSLVVLIPREYVKAYNLKVGDRIYFIVKKIIRGAKQ